MREPTAETYGPLPPTRLYPLLKHCLELVFPRRLNPPQMLQLRRLLAPQLLVRDVEQRVRAVLDEIELCVELVMKLEPRRFARSESLGSLLVQHVELSSLGYPGDRWASVDIFDWINELRETYLVRQALAEVALFCPACPCPYPSARPSLASLTVPSPA